MKTIKVCNGGKQEQELKIKAGTIYIYDEFVKGEGGKYMEIDINENGVTVTALTKDDYDFGFYFNDETNENNEVGYIVSKDFEVLEIDRIKAPKED